MRTSPLTLVIAVVAPFAVCGLLTPLRGVVANTNAALVLVLVVVGIAATGQRVAGVLAALSGTAGFDLLLTAPYGQFTISDPTDVETAVLLVVVGLAVTELALWGRRQQSRSSAREGYLTGIVAAARIVATGGTSLPDLTENVARQIRDVLDLDACRFDPGPADHGARIDGEGAVTWNGHGVDVGRDGLPTMDEIDLVVSYGGIEHGHYVLTSATAVRRPELEQRLVAVTLAEQVGAALSARPTDVHGHP